MHKDVMFRVVTAYVLGEATDDIVVSHKCDIVKEVFQYHSTNMFLESTVQRTEPCRTVADSVSHIP